MSSQTTTHAAKAPAKGAAKASSGTYISLMALVMMNVTIIGSVANDVQQAYYGLSSVTLFIIGALVFFLPTGLVAAELASGWGQRGGIFRWVGEAMGPGLAFTCLLILWFQTSINFGMGVASASATIGFYTPDWDWAVQFMNHPENQFFIILAWLAYYWGLTFLSTKGVKAFARLTKYGVIIGTFIPLAFIVIFTVVWLAQGNVSNVTPTPEAFNPFADGFSLTNLALAAGVFFSFAGIEKHPGFRLTLPMIYHMLYAVLYADLLMSLVNQVRPYEVRAGESEELAETWTNRLADELAVAMECRCYHGGEGRTKLHVLQYEGRDYLALVLGLAVTAGIIVLRQFT